MYVENNTVKPNNTIPTPTNTMDPSKTPVCIYCNYGGNLKDKQIIRGEVLWC